MAYGCALTPRIRPVEEISNLSTIIQFDVFAKRIGADRVHCILKAAPKARQSVTAGTAKATDYPNTEQAKRRDSARGKSTLMKLM
jgi:hypothetical protein